MADVVLTVQQVDKDGLAPSYTAIDATDTYYYPNGGYPILHFKNTGSEATITFDITQTVEGEAVTDPTLTVPATTGDLMAAGRGELYEVRGGTHDGRVKFSNNIASGVTVAVLRV